MSAEKDYARNCAEFKRLDARSAQGDRGAKREKNVVAQQMRQFEREEADKGRIYEPGSGKLDKDIGITKYEMQTEYLSKFNNQPPVELKDKDGKPYETTLKAHHAKRFGR